MPIESVMPFDQLILCCPLLLLPSIFPSNRVFSNERVLLTRGPKCCSFSFSVSPSSEYSGLISFKTDWLDLPAIQETLKSLLQYHSSQASVLWCLAFFMGLRADKQFGRKDGWGRNVGFGSQLSTRLGDDQLGAGAEVLLHLPSNVSRVAPQASVLTRSLPPAHWVPEGGRTLVRGASRNCCFPFVQCV